MEETRDRKRKRYLALAALLVCLASVLATIAYLQTATPVLRNTFKSAGIQGTIELLETKTQLTSGVYTKTGNPVDAEDVSYNLAPNANIPKDTFVRISDLTTQAYVFVAIKKTGFEATYGNGTEALVEASISDRWVPLMDTTDPDSPVPVTVNVATAAGEEPWPVYCYVAEGAPADTAGSPVGPTTLWQQAILHPEAILVADYTSWTNLPQESPQLCFRAYMAQITDATNTPFAAWSAGVDDGWDPDGQ